MKPYEWEIKTNYLKSKIKGQSLDQFNYVKDLVKLEYFILNPPKNWISGMCFENLKSNYSYDFDQILKELDFNQFQQYLDEKKRNTIKQKSEKELIKMWWVKYGGKV